jgi:hypothetical protein
MVQKNLRPLRSLKELGEMVTFDPEYQTIAIGAARDLGGRPSSWHDAIRLLGAYAAQTGEGKVMQAVNHCIASKKNHD